MVNIFIEQKAYIDIMIHILQFGNKSLKKTQEVMGLIFGIRAGDKITIKKIIPVKHGSDCEKQFTESDIINFNELEKEPLNEGLEPFGFYTSHPDMGYYLSTNEIKNLLYFITKKGNENAIALIGDHGKLDDEGDYGIQAFNLKDPSKGINSDFQELDTTIELPSDLSLFKVSKFLIEQGQKRMPYMEEKGVQLEVDDSIWDSFGDDESESDKITKRISPIINSLKPTVEDLDASFLPELVKKIDQFLEDIAEFVSKTYNGPNNDLVDLREAVDFGIDNVTQWFGATYQKHVEKIMAEYQRTFDMVQVAHDESMKTIKMQFVSKIAEYEKLIGALGSK